MIDKVDKRPKNVRRKKEVNRGIDKECDRGWKGYVTFIENIPEGHQGQTGDFNPLVSDRDKSPTQALQDR